jgi:hypothetical protein
MRFAAVDLAVESVGKNGRPLIKSRVPGVPSRVNHSRFMTHWPVSTVINPALCRWRGAPQAALMP